MYAKGKWEDRSFDRRHTAHKPFCRLDCSQVNMWFMQSWKPRFVAMHDGFKVLKLRYKMTTPDHEGTTLEQAPPPPLGHGHHGVHGHGAPYVHCHVSDAYNDGGPSPNYLPTGPPPYFRHRRNAYPSQGAALWVHSGSNRTGHTQFSMCIFLPVAHDGLWGLLGTMASRPRFLHDHLLEQQIALREFWMPKFKLSFHSSVVTDDGSGLRIVVDDFIHKAIVEVNEEGTEAATATMVVQGLGCAMPSPPRVDFITDHPFAYYIVEEATRAVVFAGHVLDPSKQ
ncbi:hypothetical protein VPH35_019859 [Triticum aestivum]